MRAETPLIIAIILKKSNNPTLISYLIKSTSIKNLSLNSVSLLTYKAYLNLSSLDFRFNNKGFINLNRRNVIIREDIIYI